MKTSNSMSLKSKLIVLISVLLFFNLLVGIIGLQSAQKISHDYGEIETMNLPDTTAILQALAHFRSARIYTTLLGYPNLSQELIKDMRGRIPKELEKDDQEFRKYVGTIPLEKEEADLYRPVQENYDLMKKAMQKALDLQEKSNGKEGPSLDEFRRLTTVDMMKIVDDFRVGINGLIAYQANQAKINGEKAHSTRHDSVVWIIAALIVSFVLSISLFLLILKNILKNQIELHETLATATRSYTIVHNSPNPTMMCDPYGKIIYANIASIETLRKLQSFLPISVDKMVGQSFDIFHKSPATQQKIISDPKNLPYRAIIQIGPEKAELLLLAAISDSGEYLGAAVAWSLVTEKISLISDLTEAAKKLAHSATNVLAVSSSLSAAAEETSAQANTASVASEEVNSGVQTVSSNMVEMVSAIKEITKTTNEAATMTNEAMRLTKNTNTIINKLGDSSQSIGNVIKVISSIAQQTNLLALNATIEAARAGEAGKGFAVVANEVKELANQTAKATSEISKQIETIQEDSTSAVKAIAEITLAIEKINGFSSNIAASVEEQAATTNEVTRIVGEAADGVKQISENISQVSQAAANTGKDAGSAQVAAKEVEEIATLLNGYVIRLKA